PVGAEDRPCLARDRERLADVVELAEADLLEPQPAGVLELREPDRRKARRVGREQEGGGLALRELEGGGRLPELDPGAGVLERRLEAGAGGADRPPDDPVARLVEAG